MEVKKRQPDSRGVFRREVLYTALVVAILVFSGLNSVRFFTRMDLTTSRAHSISPASRSLFQDIPEEVNITYYVSERLQERFPQPQEIIDLLSEYAASSRGTIRLTVENPGADAQESGPEAVGIVPQQLQVNEEGEQTFAVVYSGIVVSYLERFQSIPFVFSTGTLEYEITSTIRDLVANRTKSVRIVLGDETRSLDANYSFAAGQLAQSYDVQPLAAGDPVPDDVDLLMVIGAQDLVEQDLEPVADYLDRGGAVLIAVDSTRVDIDLGLVATSAADAPVFDVLQRFGITVGAELLLDEVYNQIVVQESGRGFNVQRVLPYPHWVSLIEQYTSVDHPVTSRFTGLDLYWPAHVSVSEDVNGQVIAGSTNRAWLMPEPYRTNPQDSVFFQITAEDTRGQYGVVAVVETAGTLKTGRLMVIADSDFIDNRLIQATQSGYNIAFLESSVQWLANDEDLLSIRTRAARDLRLNSIEDEGRKRSTVLFAQALNIYVVPAVVILVGVFRFARRRKRAAGGQRI